MAGTVAGGIKARNTNYKKNGKDFYKRIGSLGGANSHNGGFHANPALAKIAGAKGGRISRRGEGSSTILLKQKQDYIKKRLDKGHPVTSIAKELGINAGSLYYFLRNHYQG